MMTELNISLKHISRDLANDILMEINGILNRTGENVDDVQLTYSFTSESEDPIPCVETSTFSRYISSTTPEGRS